MNERQGISVELATPLTEIDDDGFVRMTRFTQQPGSCRFGEYNALGAYGWAGGCDFRGQKRSCPSLTPTYEFVPLNVNLTAAPPAPRYSVRLGGKTHALPPPPPVSGESALLASTTTSTAYPPKPSPRACVKSRATHKGFLFRHTHDTHVENARPGQLVGGDVEIGERGALRQGGHGVGVL